MRRLRILDCYTYPYNNIILKAFQNRVVLMPLFSIRDWWLFDEKFEEELPSLENTELSGFASTHSLCSLSQFYAMSDNTKIKDVYSSPIEYISTYEEHKPKFKKVSVPSEITFEMRGTGYFVELSSNVLRHFNRLNGQNLLLVETCLMYDSLSHKDGSEIIQMYKEKLHKIPTEINNLSVTGDPLPKFVLCRNSQVLRLRKGNMKVLQIPDFPTLSKEFKYSRILLYYPLRPGQNIDTNRLGRILAIIFYLFEMKFYSDDYFFKEMLSL